MPKHDPDEDPNIRADKKRKALDILRDLPTATDRATAIRAFVLQLHDRDKLLELMAAHEQGHLTDQEIAEPLLHGYIAAKAPMSTPGIVEFFRLAREAHGGPIRMGNDPIPVAPTILYRGSVESGKLGISWTTRRKVAKDFADRCCGKIFRYNLENENAVFGVMSKIAEFEVFIDPAYLIDVLEDVEPG